MGEVFSKLVLAIFNSTSSKQFNVLIKVIVLLSSICSATALYVYYFNPSTVIETKVSVIFKILLNPKTIIWLLFFLLIYFVIYPSFIFISLLLYRISYPASKKVDRSYITGARRGFKISGIEEVIKKVPPEKMKEVYLNAYADIIESENETVKSLSYILAILLQFIIWFNDFVQNPRSLLTLFIIAAVAIVFIIFLIIPWMFKVLRALIDGHLKKVLRKNSKPALEEQIDK